MAKNARSVVLELLARRGEVRNRDVANELGISRQAAHRHLRALVDAGEIVREGEGRGSRYVAPAAEGVLRFPTEGLREDRVWTRLLEAVPTLRHLSPDAHDVLQYAVTELVNNVVDHSGADEVSVGLTRERGRIVLTVDDRGYGIFERIREGLGLGSQLEALQELSKGKTTTQPARHTGEGIFFTSKAARFFVVTSGELRWLVDNERHDTAVERLETPRAGTSVRFELDPEQVRPLADLFDEYTEDYEFSRTRIVIKLFSIGVRFISRSEAKRLMSGLDRFRDVVLDFDGVRTIGQGFADEVLRVWAAAHPDVHVTCVNMARGVELMVERARRGPGW